MTRSTTATSSTTTYTTTIIGTTSIALLTTFVSGVSVGILVERWIIGAGRRRRQRQQQRRADFERHVRAYYSKNQDGNHNNSNSNEPCPLDLTASNVDQFQQGNWSLLIQDIRQSLVVVPYIADYIIRLLVARGAYKAFAVRQELVNYKKVCLHYLQRYERTERHLRRLLAVFHRDELLLNQQQQRQQQQQSLSSASSSLKEEQEAIKASIYLHQQLSTLRGSLAVLRDVRTWTKQMCSVSRWWWWQQEQEHDCCHEQNYNHAEQERRIFIAGDAGVYKIPKSGFGIHDLWRGFVATEQRYTASARKLMIRQQQQQQQQQEQQQHQQPSGTQPSPSSSFPNISSINNNMKKKNKRHTCSICHLDVGKVWMTQNSVCWQCADELLQKGQCPYEKGRPSHYICPHDLACFSCQDHSCLLRKCRIIRGNATTVQEMLAMGLPLDKDDDDDDNAESSSLMSSSNESRNLPFSFLFLDFDQTLASTASGGPPRPNRHGCNPVLLRILHESSLLTMPSSSATTSTTTRKKPSTRHQANVIPEVHIVTRQNHSRVDEILDFLSAFYVEFPREHLHCLGGTHVTKAQVIQRVMHEQEPGQRKADAQPSLSSNHHHRSRAGLFVDDNPAEVCNGEIRQMDNLLSILYVSKDFSCKAVGQDDLS